MNGIIGLTELALDTPLNEEQRDYLEGVKSSADSLLTILNDVLDFSKIEAGKLNLDATELSVTRVLDEVLAGLSVQGRARAWKSGIILEPKYPPASLEIPPA